MGSNKDQKDISGNPSTAYSSKYHLNDRSNGKALQIFTESIWDFWLKNRKVIIPQAIPKSYTERLSQLLWKFEEKDPEDMSTWDAKSSVDMEMKELTNIGMVEVYNHQYLWVIR